MHNNYIIRVIRVILHSPNNLKREFNLNCRNPICVPIPSPKQYNMAYRMVPSAAD